MPLVAGARLGPYEIVSALGAGGMGEVYRAKDTRLDRTVAIKVLKGNVAADSERRQRFDREARAVSSLNHPHICILHDIGHQNGIDFLVMEYIEGETLQARLAHGPLPLEQALRYAIEIAGALARAHRQGVLHRDLKPGNIMLTKSGAKLLDFGLAKLRGPASSQDGVGLSGLPTVAQALTEKGTILGTFQYMAPEQVEGNETDARADLFSFGAVLYEMLTGRKAFEGKTQASVIGAILHTDPPSISSQQPLTPAILDRVVKKCLAKDPDERWQNAQDLATELSWIAEGDTLLSSSATNAPQAHSRSFAWIAAAATLAAVALAVLLGVIHFRATPPAPVVRSALLPPSNLSFVPHNFAISPDGVRLAFVAVGPDGKNNLWVRTLSAQGGQELAGGEGASFPFWSPDSHRIGFFAHAELKIVDLAHGAAQILCQAPLGLGGAWNSDGTIVFASGVGPINRVPAAGGGPTPVTKFTVQDSGQGHRWPTFLPGGKHFFYFVEWSSPADKQRDGIYLGGLDSGETKLFSAELRGNVAFASGNVLYVRDRSLLAQPFDLARLEPAGPAVPIVDQELDKDTAFLQSGFSASENGMLVFQSASDTPSRMVWFDASGKELGQLPDAGYKDPNISPDGRFLAVSSDDERNGKHFVRIYDLQRGVSTRLTEGGTDEFPTWSRDGRRITYLTGAASGKTISMNEIPADGSGPARVLMKGVMMIPNGWSADGQLVFMDFSNGPAHLAAYSAASPQPKRLTAVASAEAHVSPDGRWFVYQAMGGRFGGDIVVQPFPGPGGRIQISSAGGAQPRWSHDGKRIFYIQADKKLMEASFDSQKGMAGTPRVLFQTRIVSSNFVLFQFDVAPDGRFLINSFPSSSSGPLTLLTNWTALLKPH